MTAATKYRLALVATLFAAAATAVAVAVVSPAPESAQGQAADPVLLECSTAVLGPGGPGTQQSTPAPPTALQFTGQVTVTGAAANQVDGLAVQVRINSDGTQCVAGNFTVGAVNRPEGQPNLSPSGRYEVNVKGNPAQHANAEITFHLIDGTTASQRERYIDYTGYPPSCIVRPAMGWGAETANCVRTGPRENWAHSTRIQNLTFPNLPQQPQPERVRAHVFFGSAFSPSAPGGLDGVRIFARVGTYTTPPALVVDGRYRLTVDPNDAALIGQPVSFFYEGSPELTALWNTVQQPQFTPGTMQSVVLNLPDPPSNEMMMEPTAASYEPQIYRGTVASLDNANGITGVSVQATIGTLYTSEPAVVGANDSSYLILVDPPDAQAAQLLNQSIEFSIVGMPTVKAFQTRLYTGASSTEDLNLVFPAGVGQGSSGGCTIFGASGASGFPISNLLMLAVPALVVFGLRLHSRYGKREDA